MKLAVILSAVLCNGTGDAQGRIRAIVAAFQNATYSKQGPPRETPELVHWAIDERRSERRHPMQRSALDYWLAMATKPGDGYVTDLTRTALRARPPLTQNLDTLSALPEALETIAFKRHNHTAWRYLLTLSLDGGPGDTLTQVRVDAFRRENREFMTALRGLCGSNGIRAASSPRIRSLVDDLKAEWQGDISFRGAVEACVKANTKRRDSIAGFTVQFCRAIGTKVARRSKPR